MKQKRLDWYPSILALRILTTFAMGIGILIGWSPHGVFQ